MNLNTQKRLMEFAIGTLGTLKRNTEWSSDTLNQIADISDRLDLSTMDDDGYFKSKITEGSFHSDQAADDLLAALEMALESLDAVDVPQEWDCRSKVRTVIAKAKGGAR